MDTNELTRAHLYERPQRYPHQPLLSITELALQAESLQHYDDHLAHPSPYDRLLEQLTARHLHPGFWMFNE